MAKRRRDAKVKLLGVVRRRRPALLVSTALCATVTMVVSLPAMAQPAPNAHPTGGAVVGGNVSISQSTSQTTINQTTQRGAVSWQSFDVGSQQSVQFNQPSSSAVTLNQVKGPNPSQIAGRIDANGQVIIENQSGVVFYKGSQVDTAGLMVSAAGSGSAATQTFLNGGKLVMDQAANPNAAVVNQGQITIKQAGLAALVAPQVVNSGVIVARLGHVVLAGATKTTLDLYGDGMLSIDVTGQVTTLPNGATALVTNSGVIVADGGTVRLTARAADGLVQNLVDAGGKIRARTIGSQTGTVTLNAVGGSITIEGQLDATGTAPGTTGGSIAVNATDNVTVASGARIDASGNAGGGLIALGTTLQRAAGGPSVVAKHTAANVTVQHGATIAANATGSGNGGRVTVLSTTATDMAGDISATGGPQGGNGGFVEVSGAQSYSLTGLIDVSAPDGAVGTMLLDPTNLDIISGSANSGSDDGLFNNGTLGAGAGGVSDTVSNGEIQTLGSTGNVLLQTSTGTIGVHATITVNNALSLEAGSDLLVDRGVSIDTGGNLTLMSGTAGTGSILLGSTGTGSPVQLTAPTVVMQAGLATPAYTYGINLNDTVINNGDGRTTSVDLSARSGGVNQSSAGSINTGTLLSSLGVTGTVNLAGSNNAIDTLGSLAVGGTGNLDITNATTMTVAGIVSVAGSNAQVYLHSAGVVIAATGSILAPGSASVASVQTDSFALITGGSIAANTFELAPDTPNGTVTLGAGGANGPALPSLNGITANSVRIGAFTTPGTTGLTTTAGSIVVAGAFGTSTVAVELDSNGGIGETARGTLTAGTLTGNAGNNVALGNVNNVGTLGSFAVTGAAGGFDLVNSGNLAITGPVGATSATITSGTIALSGSIVTPGTGSVSLTSTAGNLALSGTALLNSGAVSLSSAQSITEAATSTIIATSLSGIASNGSIMLISPSNALDVVNGLQATGGAVTLVVDPTTALTGDFIGTDLYFEVAQAGGTLQIGSGAIGATMSATAVANPTISLISDNIVNHPPGLINQEVIPSSLTAINGTVEIAPFTPGTNIRLGGTFASGTAGLQVDEGLLSEINTGQNGLLRIGNYTGGSITAGNIDVGGTVNLLSTAATLELDAAGAVTESAGPLTVGTLVGVATGFTLTAPGNAIDVLGANSPAGTLTATSSNIQVLDSGPLAVAGVVSANSGNIFLQEAAGQSLSILNGGSVVVSGGTIGLVADRFGIDAGGSVIASGTNAAGSSGTVEIAPTGTTVAVSLAGTQDTAISSVGLGLISASLLRIGGYHDQVNGGTNVVTAASIDIGGAVSLGSAVPTLRLDANGPITESVGPLSVGTLSASTNGAPGNVSLGNNLNAISALDDITVGGGNFTLGDHAGTLSIPANAVVYGSIVSIENSGSIAILGDLGAFAGALDVNGSDIIVGGGGSTPVVAATGTLALTGTSGVFTQASGLINGNGVSIGAATTLTQSGGSIVNVGSNAASVGLVMNAGSVVQSGATAVIASNNAITINGTNGIATSGTILGAGPIWLATNQGFTQNGGIIAAGGDLLVSAVGAPTTPIGGNILQNAGTLSSGSTSGINPSVLLLGNFTNSDASQVSGTVAGYSIEITSATENTAFRHFAAGAAAGTGSDVTVACVCSGLLNALVNPTPNTPVTPPSLPTLGAATGAQTFHLTLDVIDDTNPALGTYVPGGGGVATVANWVEIHTSGSLVEPVGGTIQATLLTGSSGYQASGTGPDYSFTTPFISGNNPVVSAALFNGTANSVNNLGGFLATGDFRLVDSTALDVVGAVVAGAGSGGHVLTLSAPSITVDQSGGSSVQNNLTISANGSLASGAIVASGSVTPGQILLQADTLAVLPLAANGTPITAPDGLVAIAPYTAGATISLDANAASSTGTLSLSAALLSTITTTGTSAGTAGTETLLLGSLDGATPIAGAIDINTGFALNSGVARNLVLDATGVVQETAAGSLDVTSLAGLVSNPTSGTGFLLTNRNTIAELGNVFSRTAGGTTWTTSGTVGTGLLSLTSNGGNIRVTDTGTLTAVGGVVANSPTLSGTIALTAPGIAIVSGPLTLPSGTIVSGGSLLASAGPVSGGGTLSPGAILLQTDALTISGGSGIVAAPSGQVAIAPLTAGNTISIDAVPTPAASTLSLGVNELALIDTLSSGPAAGMTPGPAGTQTLSLGSVNNGASVTAGTIVVNAFLQLGSAGATPNQAANTLALYSNNGVMENAGGSIAVNTLTGTVGSGSIYLTGANRFTNLGNLATRGAITTPGGNANLLAPAGNILIGNAQALNVVTNVQASAGAANYAEIDVLAPSNGYITVLNGGTVQGGSAYLRAGDTTPSGNVTGVTVAAGGAVLALASVGEADLVTGVDYTPTTPGSAPSSAYTTSGGGLGQAVIDGVVNAGNGGTVAVFATTQIIEPGTIQAGLLRGYAGSSATLTGTGSPTSNLIADLGPFTSGSGFTLHDAEALAVVAPVTDGSTAGITISVAPAGNQSGFGAGDLAIGAPLSALIGGVRLEATGNVYETTSTTILNAGGTFAVGGGSVAALSLVSEAGVIPDTETGGNTAGTIPSGATFGRAIDWFGNLNNVGTIAGVTATGNFLLYTGKGPAGQYPTVSGTLIAGTLPLTTATIAPAYPVTAGPFGTTPNSNPAPFAEIDVTSGGNLLIPGVVHVGLDGALAGNVTLRAGNSTTAGSVNISGGLYAADGGTVSISAGFDPTISPVSAGYDAGCGNLACAITIGGTIWGDASGATLARLITLNAASSIDETGAIGATTLTGAALGHAVMLGGGSPTANRVANLSTFDTNGGGYNDASGFQLRDGRALLVNGAVTDHGTTASQIAIAVAPPGSGPDGYGTGDLVLASAIAANAGVGTVKLQATGNVYETTGGSVTGATLTSQAGVIPDTEAGVGNTAGSIPASPVSQAIDFFGNVNQVATLGNVTATGSFLVYDGQALTVGGAVMAGAAPAALATAPAAYPVQPGEFGTTPTAGTPFAEIDVLHSGSPAGNLTIASAGIVHAGLDAARAGNVTLRAGNSITAGSVTINDGGVYAADGGTVTISAGFDPTAAAASAYYAACGSVACDITINGTIWGDLTGATPALASVVTLDAASAIDEPVTSGAIGATLLTGHAGWHADLGEVGPQTANSYVLAATPSANRIVTLGTFASNAAQGGVTQDDPLGLLLRDGQTLIVTGPVTDGGATASQGISIAVVPGSGSTYTAGDLLLRGNVSAATSSGSVKLQATGNVVQSAGSITAGTLVAQAGAIPNTEVQGNQPGTLPGSPISSTGSIMLGDANQVLHLGGSGLGASAQGGIIVVTVPALTVNGNVVSAHGAVTVSSSNDITNNATLDSVAGSVTVQTPADITNNGLVSGATSASLMAGGVITNNGSVTSGGAASLNAGGAITNGGLVSGGTNAGLTAGAGITNNGLVTAGNAASLDAGGSLTNNGGVSGGNDVTLIGASVTNNGDVYAGVAATVSASGNIVENGTLSAPTIQITSQTGEIVLGNGVIVTGGATRPLTGINSAAQLPPNTITTLGAYLIAPNVVQTGNGFTVRNLPGTTESILSITLNPNGAGNTAQFSGGGLIAPNTWLIMSVGNGQAGGPIDVRDLDFTYLKPPGRADFTGSIHGEFGYAAAGAAFIEPQQNPNFKVDGCPIHSVNCLLLATEGVPVTNPANDILLGAPLNNENPEDLVLPVVSDERYESNDILLGSPLAGQNPSDLVLPGVSNERNEMAPCDNPSDTTACPPANKQPAKH